jgi:BirA family transcriptional regulator, biotin operon repressor / biotin---[acetyl-CoA-carboxylase] ligase
VEGGAADPAAWLSGLDARIDTEAILGRPLRTVGVVVSTDAAAQAWARQEDAPDGALLVAGAELSGRRHRGQPWPSVAGESLACSIILRPELPARAEALLWVLAALGAAEGTGAASGRDVTVGWPADLLVDGLPVGGITVSSALGPGRVEWAALTVRVLARGSHAGLHSLAELGAEVALDELLLAILDRLASRYDGDVSTLFAALEARCSTVGATVRVRARPHGELTGRAVAVDELGRLVVEQGQRRVPLSVDQVQSVDVLA